MGLNYDFDIHFVVPLELFERPQFADTLKNLGITPNARGNYMALFRDPRTAAALSGASEQVKGLFQASGFGFNTYHSGAPDGFYPARDERFRADVLSRLTANLDRFTLRGQHTNGFDFAGFAEAVVRARPIQDRPPAPPRPPSFDMLAELAAHPTKPEPDPVADAAPAAAEVEPAAADLAAVDAEPAAPARASLGAIALRITQVVLAVLFIVMLVSYVNGNP